MLLGIDNLIATHYKCLRNKHIGICTNISSCDSLLQPIIAILLQQKKLKIKLILAPEHGLYGALQDQQRAKTFYDGDKKMWIYSLYGRQKVPPKNTLKELDAVLIDLQDIGTRYYTFLWSAILLIEQMAKLKKKVIILDRPNPLNGINIEGPVLEANYASFVGLYPIPVRHGLTLAELCNLVNAEYDLGAEIEVIKMKNWQRYYYYNDTGLRWTVPSPNMPSFTTACVYPGMCLLEGTNISEGRGTTRPFEIFGAPWIDSLELVKKIKKAAISGADFRPTYFIPTFNKYKGKLCGGAHIYVRDLKKFDPVLIGLTIIKAIKELYPDKFRWRKPPYEFEKDKLPFDILIGNSWIRKAIESNTSIKDVKKRWQRDLLRFKKIRKKYLLYK